MTARHSIRIAEIRPADIIAEADVSYADYELLDESPRSVERLEYAIADAAAAMLPDGLLVHQDEHIDSDGHTTRFWSVLQGLDPATTQVAHRGLEDDATPALRDAVAWLAHPRHAGSTIGIDTLVREAVRNADLARLADA